MKVKLASASATREKGPGPSHRHPVQSILVCWMENEHTRWYPKDGELCLDRMKPKETWVEVRSGSDVQIERVIWV